MAGFCWLISIASAGATPMAGGGPSDPCRAAAAAAERSWGIPAHLLGAIARIESGRADGSGDRSPWPWTINSEGVGSVYDSKAAAISAVRALQAKGVQSIDVGCMQVNLMHHPQAFGSLEEAFDPMRNADYAGRFLSGLHDQTGSWPGATGAYHSFTPDLRRTYLRQVLEAWPLEALGGSGRGTTALRDAEAGGGAAPGAGGPGAGGPGAIMLSNGSERAKMLPAAANAAPGRGLDAYRSLPIVLANRPGRTRS